MYITVIYRYDNNDKIIVNNNDKKQGADKMKMYHQLSDKVKGFVISVVILGMSWRSDASIQQVTLDQGLGFVGYFLIGMIMLTRLILIGVGGYQLSQDSGKP